jgi:hypothetical protein
MHCQALPFLSSLTIGLSSMQVLVQGYKVTVMQLVIWQDLIILAEELQSDISWDKADEAVIRLDKTNNTLINLETMFLKVVGMTYSLTRIEEELLSSIGFFNAVHVMTTINKTNGTQSYLDMIYVCMTHQ